MPDRPDYAANPVYKHFVEHLQGSVRLSTATNLHEDSMLKWLVGLSAAGVGGVVGDGRFLDLWALLPWVLAVVTGLHARTRLAKLMYEDQRFEHQRGMRLALLPYAPGLKGHQDFGSRVQSIWEEPPPGQALTESVNRWVRTTLWLFYLGTVLVTIVVFRTYLDASPTPP